MLNKIIECIDVQVFLLLNRIWNSFSIFLFMYALRSEIMLLIESSAMADDLVRCMGMVISRGMPSFQSTCLSLFLSDHHL